MIRTALMLVTWLASLTAVSAFDPNIVDYEKEQHGRKLGSWCLTDTCYRTIADDYNAIQEFVRQIKQANNGHLLLLSYVEEGVQPALPECEQIYNPDNKVQVREFVHEALDNSHADVVREEYLDTSRTSVLASYEADLKHFVELAIDKGHQAVVRQAYQDANACN